MIPKFYLIPAACLCAMSLASCASSPDTPVAATAVNVAQSEAGSQAVESSNTADNTDGSLNTDTTKIDENTVVSDVAVTETEPEKTGIIIDGEHVSGSEIACDPRGDVTDDDLIAAAGVVDNAGTVTSGETSAHVQDNLTEVQKLMLAGDFVAARKLAMENLRSGNASDASEVWAVVEADPMLSHTLDDEVRPHGTNVISALGGGSTVSFKYTDSADESAKAALKPDQDLRQTMYRSGIAYYRACQILGCSFDLPVTRPARFSKGDFNALYNASSSSKNRGYRSKFEHLIWAKEDGSAYLYAGYKEWISPFTSFPIEVTSAWSPLLKNPDAKLPEVRSFLKNILAGGRPDAIKNLDKLMEYAGDLTTRDLLRQISDMILLDYLTNNWDRFAGEQSNYGANCHFHPGGIIGIDNDAAFPAWHAPRVVRRLNMVEMFSRELVNNLRMLDPDELLIHLFPNPTKEEQRSFERFKERRADALKYIDGLIRKKGEDRVLVF